MSDAPLLAGRAVPAPRAKSQIRPIGVGLSVLRALGSRAPGRGAEGTVRGCGVARKGFSGGASRYRTVGSMRSMSYKTTVAMEPLLESAFRS